jgi:hypothetical protein
VKQHKHPGVSHAPQTLSGTAARVDPLVRCLDISGAGGLALGLSKAGFHQEIRVYRAFAADAGAATLALSLRFALHDSACF